MVNLADRVALRQPDGLEFFEKFCLGLLPPPSTASVVYGVYDAFTKRLAETAGAMKVADGFSQVR